MKDGLVIAVHHYNLEKSHSSVLHVTIDQMIKNVGVNKTDIDAVAVAEGPGSYTGLRIGASSAKGLAFALEIPLIAINTLEAMAYKVFRYSTNPIMYCPMIDARRMEVFTMLLDEQFKVVKATVPVILEEYAFEDVLESKKVVFFGDGSDKTKNVILHKNASFINDVVPSAEEVALLALSKYESKQFENIVSFEPFYLKEFRLAKPKKK